MKNKTITILYGLPGCGKTTYATNHNDTSMVIDMDRLMRNSKSQKKMLDDLVYEIGHSINSSFRYKSKTSFIIDGLFTTNAQVKSTIEHLTSALSKYDFIFNLVWWEEDRETCLINDKGRRNISASKSITTLPFEIPDAEFLGLNPKHIFKMRTEKKAQSILWAESLGLDPYESSEMTMKSSSWSLGGTFGNCWDDTKHETHADSEPEFIQFDSLMEKITPDISFLKYKKIKSACCSIVTRCEDDYYGGSARSAHHSCDLEKLYNMLHELKMI